MVDNFTSSPTPLIQTAFIERPQPFMSVLIAYHSTADNNTARKSYSSYLDQYFPADFSESADRSDLALFNIKLPENQTEMDASYQP